MTRSATLAAWPSEPTCCASTSPTRAASSSSARASVPGPSASTRPEDTPRGVLRRVGDLLLLFTEGEHRRSGAAYFPQLHRLSPEGELLWSLRARCVGEPLLVGEHLLVPVRMARSQFEPEDRAELYVQVRDPDTGILLAMYPVRPPPVLERAYVHAVRGVGVRLRPQGDAVEVTVSAWFTGRQAPPRGAGEFAVRIALY